MLEAAAVPLSVLASEALERVELALTTPGTRPPVVLIDGRSGAGKSTLATVAAERVAAARIIRLDDIYPGWNGLEEARRHLLTSVLEPLVAGRRARWRRWDWAANGPAEWEDVDADAPLIVEGVGALSLSSRRLAQLGLWIELDDAARKARALARDGATFAPHWQTWAAQENAFVAHEHPSSFADVIVDGRSITE